MRVAHFIQRYPPALGGSEAYFRRLGRHLVGVGDDVDVWTTNARDLEAFWSPDGGCLPAGVEDDDGVRVQRFPLAGRMRGRRWLLKPLSLVPLRLWQCLTLPCNPISFEMWRGTARSHRHYDLVHATAFPYAWPIVCGLRLARRLGVPFLLTPFLHLGDPTNPADRTRRQYTAGPFAWLLRSADRVFVQTDAEADAACELGVVADRIVCQGLGVDASECTAGDRRRARSEWHVEEAVPVVGHLANCSVEKGTVDLLKAAQILWQRGIRFELVLAGPEMPNLRHFIAGFPFADRVRRLGSIDEEAKKDFFAGIDVFALPSRSDSFGLVLLEAWANRLPNIVYRAGGPAELVRHERDGLQVHCGDVAVLAEQLARLVTDPVMRSRLGAEGRSRIEREFRWQQKLEAVRDEMKSVSDASQKRNAPATLRQTIRTS
jgi:glycosyltransferase involved in cell wall biosynthesis